MHPIDTAIDPATELAKTQARLDHLIQLQQAGQVGGVVDDSSLENNATAELND